MAQKGWMTLMAMMQTIDMNDAQTLRTAGTLVRRAFATVAAEFHLTKFNCPTYPAFQSDDALLLTLYQPGAACFGAFQRSAMVGFVALLPRPRATMELTLLCVDPAYRHREIGMFLVEYAQVYAKKQSVARMTVNIINENQRLKSWCRANGFVPLQTRRVRGLPYLVCEMVKTIGE
jgi:ribosomal protein S18 acetylase RimI-like enzyme